MQLNHKFCAMVACHLNFQFQVLTLLKRTKELGLAHFIVDVPKKVSKCIPNCGLNFISSSKTNPS